MNGPCLSWWQLKHSSLVRSWVISCFSVAAQAAGMRVVSVPAPVRVV